ncbi:MAG TPA: tail fiber domain-containing protein [Candidatus Limnocylindrales bacterium]|nr:tail fiber domain-containing protein [Candidatus Limnocylindrales bacterium]
MTSPKAPKPPDAIGAAREQGQQNINAARTTAALNRVNQVGPGGTVTFSQDPTNPDQYTQTTQLSPEQQRIYDAQTGAAGTRAEAAGRNFDLYGQSLGQGLNTSGLPARQFSANPTDQQTGINASSVAQRRISTMGLPQLPGQEDFSGERQRVEDALYGRSARRLDDQFGRREEAERSRLLASGLIEGTEAYERQMRDLNEARTDAYGDLRDRAVLAGGQEQSRLFGQQLQARQQGFGERTTQGQFANQAANQNFQNEMARSGFFNDAQQQEFMQRLANAQLGNQQRDAGINEQVTDQQKTLQGLDFLYGGSGAMVPQALAPGSSGQVAPTDIQGAIQQDYNNRFGNYSQQAQQAQQQQAALSSIALALAFSDRRLKTDIKREGTTPSGLGIYSYRYKAGGERQLGAMADEVKQIYPEAVVKHESGYDMVDYGIVTSREMEDA